MSHPTKDEREAYEDLCESMGEEQSLAGGHEGLESGGPSGRPTPQPDLYPKLVPTIAKEEGFDPASDPTIVPYIQGKVRADINNFRTAWKYGRWLKEGKEWVHKPCPNHPYSKVDGAEGLKISEPTEKAKIAAFKAAGIETLSLPKDWEEGKGDYLLDHWVKQLSHTVAEEEEEEEATKEVGGELGEYGGEDGESESEGLAEGRCPPRHWHDSANCPTVDIECGECEIRDADDSGVLVSAFQTAFGEEDDDAFALVFALDMISLWCVVLKQAAGGTDGRFHMVHSLYRSRTTAEVETPAVDEEPPAPIEPEMPLLHQFVDGEPPSELSFTDKMSVQLGFNDGKPLSINRCSLNPVVGGDRFRPPMSSWITAAAAPALFVCVSMLIMGASAQPAVCTWDVPPPVVPGHFLCYQNCTVEPNDFFNLADTFDFTATFNLGTYFGINKNCTLDSDLSADIDSSFSVSLQQQGTCLCG
ncbi:hypothetical protein CYMTET_9350 [Cymbomonas tetramitiformis]|uniref:Uncharacterized protein n=1 Tax=Cymbomonas tetramitiformis TaxID=36881 RepID=A0AAE0GRP5_9CHLO|nr:hypothetical protein CYMTET_9350 [Cymbomonas tetramitiformis]